MAWEVVKRRMCEVCGEEAFLLEERTYAWPSSEPDAGPYIVEARRCSRDVACNMMPHSNCRWAFTNPSVDPFE